VKRRDLLIGSFAVLGSAALSAGGVAVGLSSLLPAPKVEASDEPPAAKLHAAASTGATSTHAAPVANAHGAATGEAPHWGYEGATGPARWGDLDPANAACKVGGAQSPIDLNGAVQLPSLQPLNLSYGPTRVKISHNGHTYQVNYDKGSSLVFNGKRYDLLQFHYHTPSEHTLAGKVFPMEVHFVHQAADKSLAVIGVLMAEGAPNTFLASFWDKLPRVKSDVDTNIMLNALDALPKEVAAAPTAAGKQGQRAMTIEDYYTYAGSLTTPPCSETVSWLVLRRPIEVSKAQIAAFREVFPMNSRPTQPIGPRTLLLT
jgi:carbonic anhydrase